MEKYDAKEAQYLQDTCHMDESASVFLARQLTHIRSQVLTVKKAPLNAFQVFPVQTDIPAGAETAVQYIYDAVGMAEIISNYADDLHRVDVIAKEQAVKVFALGDAYGYNHREVKNAMFAGVNLSAMKAQQARRGIDVKLNQIAWEGDTDHNITGFLNNPNISTMSLAADGTGSKTTLSTKTTDQMIRDMNNIIDAIPTATNEVEQANTVLMAPSVYRTLSETRIPDGEGQTVLGFLRAVHPEINRWMKVGELKGAGTDGTDMVVAGYFDPMYVRFEIPTRFEQLPVQYRNLEYVIDCVAEAVGVTVTMPMAFVKAQGC
jgi:hypothetical protein